VLVGDDPGVADAVQHVGGIHIPTIDRNAYGSPTVSSVFRKALECVRTAFYAYVNCDILLGDEFVDSLLTCSRKRKFLMVGRRTNLDVSEPLALNDELGWSSVVRRAQCEGVDGGDQAIDYFGFPCGLWQEMPPFALGRCAWDNWLLFEATRLGACLIDASPHVLAIHQTHDYSHAQAETQGALWRSDEAKENYRLAGNGLFDLVDCRCRIRGNQLVPCRDPVHVWRRVERLRLLRPNLWRRLASWKVRYLVCWLLPRL
jgi:hypothetical protein